MTQAKKIVTEPPLAAKDAELEPSAASNGNCC